MRGLETDGQNRQNETARSANMVFLRISTFQNSHRSYIFFQSAKSVFFITDIFVQSDTDVHGE